ncbi:MAG TPA: branched-chain amino acid ABC transporter permease [Stellaceae bacterium]|nr:branched-chain amino acid ABC transporter permease [Stellaceae bacterium]
MGDLIHLITAGLATGAIYALVAIGFVLLWQTSQTINFAQGQFVMLPAFFVLAAMKQGGLPLWAAVLVGIAASVLLLGVGFKKLIVDPMRRHGVLPLVIATVALGLLLEESTKTLFSAQAEAFPALVPSTTFNVLGAPVSLQDLSIIGFAIVAVVALQLFLTRTTTGRCMQAAAQNPEVARILGIPVERMILLTFVINATLVAIASVLISPIYLAKFSNGGALGVAAFVAAIVGGFNQIRGAIVGGLLLGVVSNLAAAYISAQYRDAIPLILLILVILFRPRGLAGRAEERTV